LIVGIEGERQVSVEGATPTGDAESDLQSIMIDVSGMSLTELAFEGDGVLAQSLRRLADDLARPDEPIAGFNSAF
jgi:FXSXX-COOH protein